MASKALKVINVILNINLILILYLTGSQCNTEQVKYVRNIRSRRILKECSVLIAFDTDCSGGTRLDDKLIQ